MLTLVWPSATDTSASAAPPSMVRVAQVWRRHYIEQRPKPIRRRNRLNLL